ncbi:coiled-coil domain-containing protein 86 [Centrocercus urophasianus]|uniref:coiled-coil domain-containing protein 86 n=1 Tax=Centrocercus urophasianus TaxID=9002 RepID=UPI001C64AF8A|nr:coiled-coil domain-containing protein 86 [Centrocercus urophasianus]
MCAARCDVISRRLEKGAAWRMEGCSTAAAPGSEGPSREGSVSVSVSVSDLAQISAVGPVSEVSQVPARRKAAKKRKEAAVPAIPRGRPKSGRVWKDPGRKRFSLMVQDKPLRTSWERKLKERQEKKLVRDLVQQLQEAKQREREEKKRRREENLRRRLENERKAEIVQVIRNPMKLKRAKKKQLRRVEKRDTLGMFQKAPMRGKAAAE